MLVWQISFWRQFGFHNEAIDETKCAKNDDEEIYVDVITGASTGGMTAAMLPQW